MDQIKESPLSAIFRCGYLVSVLHRVLLHKTDTASDKEMKSDDFYTFRDAENDKKYMRSKITPKCYFRTGVFGPSPL